jgi:hypothetical protein
LSLFGDDDGGRALGLSGVHYYSSFPEAVSTAAVMFKRGDFKQHAGKIHEETLWLLGPEASTTFEELPASTRVKTAVSYQRSGYSVQRSDWGPRASHLVLDHGGHGICSGGHAHSDCLAFTLSVEGRDMLVDPGTFCYAADSRSREWFRSTPAHNTVTIDNVSQSDPEAAFGWQTRANGRLLQTFEAGTGRYWEAQHDGYMRLPCPVIHKRRILSLPGDYWIIADDFSGCGAHSIDWSFHFSPDAQVTPMEGGCRAQIAAASLQVSIHGSSSIDAEIRSGRFSGVYGHERISSVLHAGMRSRVPAAAICTLIPGDAWSSRVQPLEVEGNAVATAIHRGEICDLAVVSFSRSEVSVCDFNFIGEFLWVQLRDGKIQKLIATEVSRLRFRSLTIADSSSAVAHIYMNKEVSQCAVSQDA